MTKAPLSEEALRWACSRLLDFATVNGHKDQEEKAEALTVLRESLGMTDEVRDFFVSWADAFMDSEEYTPAMFLAFLLGAMTAAYEYES